MYSWTLGIQDAASPSLSAITQNLETTTSAAMVTQTAVTSVGSALSDTPTVAKTANERIKEIGRSAIDLQRAYEFASYSLESMPEKWNNIRASITDTIVAYQQGNWMSFAESITMGGTAVIGTFNNIRTVWEFTSTSFVSFANATFPTVWASISTGAAGAMSWIRGIGSTLLTQTLPSVLTFVGQSVVSFAGYVASLVGATGAQAALNAVMLANPIGLIVVGIAAVGTAVYGLIAYWDDVKSWLVDFTNFFIENSPFGFLYRLMDKVFPSFTASVRETFSAAFSWVNDYFIKPVSAAVDWLMGLFDKFTTGIQKDVSAAMSVEATVSQDTTDYYKNLFGSGDRNPFKSTPMSVGEMVEKAATEDSKGTKRGQMGAGGVARSTDVKGGGGQIKNINIRIDKLVDKIENHFSSGNQFDERKIREAVKNALIAGVNDFNYQ
jgi:hypothetical protein